MATCVLYYGYQDAVKMRHMLQEGAKENNTSLEQQRRNTESVNKMVSDRPMCMPKTCLEGKWLNYAPEERQADRTSLKRQRRNTESVNTRWCSPHSPQTCHSPGQNGRN